MNRLYVAESTPSLTGAKADHHWLMRGSEVEIFARALAAAIDPKMSGFTARAAILPVEQAMARRIRCAISKRAGGNGTQASGAWRENDNQRPCMPWPMR